MTIDREYLLDHFQNYWMAAKQDKEKHKRARPFVIENCKPDDWVLDIGCHDNPFKGYIKNLVGIDPAHPDADYQVWLEDFVTDMRFDVAVSLGAINFGDEEDIHRQIRKAITLLKPKCKFIWRCYDNVPDEMNTAAERIVAHGYAWSFEKLREFAHIYGFRYEQEGYDILRMKCVWVRD